MLLVIAFRPASGEQSWATCFDDACLGLSICSDGSPAPQLACLCIKERSHTGIIGQADVMSSTCDVKDVLMQGPDAGRYPPH